MRPSGWGYGVRIEAQRVLRQVSREARAVSWVSLRCVGGWSM